MSRTVKVRFYSVVVIMLLLFLVVFARLFYLTVIAREFLVDEGNARSVRMLSIPALRGMILDRNGAPLAISSKVYDVWMNNDATKLNAIQLAQLADILGIPTKKLAQLTKQLSSRNFIYLKRRVSPETQKTLKHLKLPGIHYTKTYKRYYPERESMAHLLGFTNIDEKGIEGLELSFDDWLGGEAGQVRVIKDRLGRVISELETVKEPKSGKNLTLSIDRSIQYLAYQELLKTVKRFHAKSGTVVVLKASTGEILAMTNVPSYDPNYRNRLDASRMRNRAVTDLFEPGSVLKAFSIASALENKVIQTDSIIDTNPSWMLVDGNIIRDEHDYGKLKIIDILKRSSNVGVTKIVLAQPSHALISMFHALGFGSSTQSHFPGEVSGYISENAKWSPFVLATLGFGYGISVTPLQLVQAYSIFANDGILNTVSLLPVKQPILKKAVISSSVSKEVLKMLEAVVEEGGTGRFARVPGFRVAGKTGTSRIAGRKGYEKNRHIATFVGMAPAKNPLLIIAVVIREPRKISYYGSQVAAPLFSKIMAGSLLHLGIKAKPGQKATS